MAGERGQERKQMPVFRQGRQSLPVKGLHCGGEIGPQGGPILVGFRGNGHHNDSLSPVRWGILLRQESRSGFLA